MTVRTNSSSNNAKPWARTSSEPVNRSEPARMPDSAD